MAYLMAASLKAQTISLNMTVDEFTSEFGKPDSIVPYGVSGRKCEFFFYGNDSFSFMDGALTEINIFSTRFGLRVLGLDEIKVGVPASVITGNLKEWFRECDSYGKFRRYVCLIEDGRQIIQVQIYDDEISYFSINKTEKVDFSEKEFREFFKSSFNPTDSILENSLWPAGLDVDWQRAIVRKSKDAGSATYFVPFIGKFKASAEYDGKRCPEVAGRLAISKALDESDIFKPCIVSLVPKSGLHPGDEFIGLVVYNNANSGTTFAWEYYEKGSILYSHFPASKVPVTESEIILEMRRTHKLIYTGGVDGISDEDWAMIVTNRINATNVFTQSLPQGWDEKKVLAERLKYRFFTSANPDYVEPDEDDCSDLEETFEDENERAESIEGQEQVINDYIGEPLPTYLGKADNLSSILRPKKDLVKVSMERNEEDGSLGTMTCENRGYSDCTIITDQGQIYRAYPGSTAIKDAILRSGYHWFIGNAISKVNVKFPYAMPLAPGTKVKLIQDPREKFRSFVVLAEIGTPVFAMRAGQVCDTDDANCILVVHKDGTFAVYMNVEDRCVFPGDYIYPGDRMGSCGGGRLSISIFYLDKNKIKNLKESPYTHYTPYFETADGPAKLEAGTGYVSYIDSEIITKEMSAGQRKRYLQKSPQ